MIKKLLGSKMLPILFLGGEKWKKKKTTV